MAAGYAMSRTYIGVRTFRSQGGAVASVLVEQAGTRTPLRHVPVHSPTGLEWGYGGSGPADTALAILLDATGEANLLPRSAFRSPLSKRARAALEKTRSYALYQSFKWEVVARLPKTSTDLEHAIRPVPADTAVEEWRITQDDVLGWLGSSATSHERGHHAG
jgi:hypothetical protein